MVDLTPILPHVTPALLVLTRLTGLFAHAPFWSNVLIPWPIKAFFALILTAAVYPAAIPVLQAHDPHVFEWTFWSIVPAMAMEYLLGYVVGFLAALPANATHLAGATIGQQLGIGLAQEFDPAFGDTTDVVGQLLTYLAMFAFVAQDGFEIVVAVVLRSFENIPLAGYRPDADLLAVCLGMLASAFELAIRVAAPILCLVFLETFALGFINKTSPAFNILSLGFPLRVLIGTATLIVAVPTIGGAVFDGVADATTVLCDYVLTR